MQLYSVKMRASQRDGGRERHISGAEKIVSEERLEKVVSQLMERALHHAKGRADFINLKVEAVSPEEVTHLEALPVTTCPVDTVEEGRRKLLELLEQAGIACGEEILARMETPMGCGGPCCSMWILFSGWSLTGSGACGPPIWMQTRTGRQGREKNHFREALVLATKVAHQKISWGSCASPMTRTM